MSMLLFLAILALTLTYLKTRCVVCMRVIVYGYHMCVRMRKSCVGGVTLFALNDVIGYFVVFL